jgi:histidine ammonia-lyase
MMTVLQAIDYLKCTDRLSTETRHIYTEVRKIFPKFIEDEPKYKDLERIKKYFEKSDPVVSFKLGKLPKQVAS